jgi:hypothetical protein
MVQQLTPDEIADIARHEPTTSHLYQYMSYALGHPALQEVLTLRKTGKSYDAIAAILVQKTGILVSREGCRRWVRLYDAARKNETTAPAETA